MQYQWKWQKVDRAGVCLENSLPFTKKPSGFNERRDVFVSWNEQQLMLPGAQDFRWRAYLGSIPDIAPPEPELRLPEEWTWKIEVSDLARIWIYKDGVAVGFWCGESTEAVIRAAQAAVDELEKG